MPDSVAGELPERGWMANPLVFLLHDGRPLPQARGELVEVDYDVVRELRDLWHGEIPMAAVSARTRRLRQLGLAALR